MRHVIVMPSALEQRGDPSFNLSFVSNIASQIVTLVYVQCMISSSRSDRLSSHALRFADVTSVCRFAVRVAARESLHLLVTLDVVRDRLEERLVEEMCRLWPGDGLRALLGGHDVQAGREDHCRVGLPCLMVYDGDELTVQYLVGLVPNDI